MRRSGVAVVRPVGRFFGGSGTRELESKIGALVSEGHPILVIDLERTLYLNTTAIGVLVGAHVRAARRGAEVRLCNIDCGIQHTLVILKLVNEMHVYDTLRDAITTPLGTAPEDAWTPNPQSVRPAASHHRH